MLASYPASMVNQKHADLGIPNRFNLTPSRFSILGLLAYSVLTLLPLVAAIKYWNRLSVQEKISVLDVLLLLRKDGVFRRLCLCLRFPVFLGMAIGIVALKRKEFVPPSSKFETVPAAIDASSRST